MIVCTQTLYMPRSDCCVKSERGLTMRTCFFSTSTYFIKGEIMARMNLFYVLFFFLVVKEHCKAVTLHAMVLNQKPEHSITGESSQSQQPSMKISTGRMKPVSSPSSPRYQEALRDIHGAFRHNVKAVSHAAILPDPTTHHQYPKVSVKPGRQDSNVISFFHHPAEPPKGGQPYQYLQHTKFEELSDIHQPAKRYRIGQQKANVHSEETTHVANMITEMHSAGWNQPKAALVHSLPGDARAKSKRPTVNVNPGRLYGNLVTIVYGPPSPTNKKGKETQKTRSLPPSDRGESSKRARVQ